MNSLKGTGGNRVKGNAERLKKYSTIPNEPINGTSESPAEESQASADTGQLSFPGKDRRTTFGYQRPRWYEEPRATSGGQRKWDKRKTAE